MREIENKHFRDLRLMQESICDIHFLDCTFENCTVDACRLEGCVFTECTFRNCRLSNNKSALSEMRSGIFEGCSLVNVNWFHWTPTSKITQQFDRLTNCDLRYNYFQDDDLTRFDFRTNRILESMFSDCKMFKAVFRDCDLSKTEFARCDLRDADFRDAQGYRISIQTNKLKGAFFSAPEALSLLADLGIKLD